MHFLGRIHPFYAIKSNPKNFITEIIAELGGSFDCASFEELNLVRETCGNNFDYATRITLISEPGRYFSSGGMTLLTGIIARHVHNRDYKSNEKMMKRKCNISSTSNSSKDNADENSKSVKAIIENSDYIYYINIGDVLWFPDVGSVNKKNTSDIFYSKYKIKQKVEHYRIDKLIAIKKALARFDQQRDRDTEILRTVTEN
ncbi:unnamed protein product [Rotaria sp. Silwood2]|nr:unnamed protein product [Rotaria sp. Silwood2]